MDHAELERQLGVEFRNEDLLTHALTHRSYWNDDQRNRPRRNNERLEFLGDAVLELVVTEHLFQMFPDEQEGELTEIRAKLVSTIYLSSIGEEGGLFDYILMSRGERQTENGRSRERILACVIEAIIGALYLDQGYDAASKFIQKKLLSNTEHVVANASNPKSDLQELAQRRLKITPSYRVIDETGLDHVKRFVVGVYFGSILIAKGYGPSKKLAEVKAAESALILKGWAHSLV